MEQHSKRLLGIGLGLNEWSSIGASVAGGYVDYGVQESGTVGEGEEGLRGIDAVWRRAMIEDRVRNTQERRRELRTMRKMRNERVRSKI